MAGMPIAGGKGPSHIPRMVTILSILLALSLTVVVGVLLTGIIAFTRGGAFHDRYATTLMNMRVGAQLVAVIAFALLVHILH